MKKKSPAWRAKLAQSWRKDIRPLLVLAAVLFSLRSSLADWNDVPSGSMKPTLVEGDRIFVNKLAYDLKVPFTTWHLAEWGGPSRGEVVVFFSPYDGTRLVKRVIGLPGDTVEMRAGRLFLNGEQVPEIPIDPSAIAHMAGKERVSRFYSFEQLPGKQHAKADMPFVQSRRDMSPLRIPENQYFMMGDNRDESFDSRYFGLVERRRIVGRAQTVVFSLDRENVWMPRAGRFFEPL